MTQKCISGCLENAKYRTWFFCNSSRTAGYCCNDNSRLECNENATVGRYCSNRAVNQSIARYAYCPRRTDACQTIGKALVPLINQVQRVKLLDIMNGANSDVCNWEIKVDKILLQ